MELELCNFCDSLWELQIVFGSCLRIFEWVHERTTATAKNFLAEKWAFRSRRMRVAKGVV